MREWSCGKRLGLWAVILIAFWVAGNSPSRASAELCEAAALAAAAEAGVPQDVMRAITILETGRRRDGAQRPWPWSVNDGVEGHWFPTRQAAITYIDTLLAEGRQSFDLGCFQLNYRWHSAVFPSVEAMIDPHLNARHAARFLRDLYEESRDWTTAAGAYHSRTPVHAERYRSRFAVVLAGLGPDQPAVSVPLSVNRFPFLQGGMPAGHGSIVPVTPPRNALLLTARTRLIGG